MREQLLLVHLGEIRVDTALDAISGVGTYFVHKLIVDGATRGKVAGLGAGRMNEVSYTRSECLDQSTTLFQTNVVTLTIGHPSARSRPRKST